jgi:hypothetical protein
MRTISKEVFLKWAKFKPLSLIGTEIIFKTNPCKICDISVSGDSIFIKHPILKTSEWCSVNDVDDIVVINKPEDKPYHRVETFTFGNLNRHIEKLDRYVGRPTDDNIKSLFEQVDSLNKEVLELRLKIDGQTTQEKDAIDNKAEKKPLLNSKSTHLLGITDSMGKGRRTKEEIKKEVEYGSIRSDYSYHKLIIELLLDIREQNKSKYNEGFQ